MEGTANSKLSPTAVANFFLALHCTSPKGLIFVSAHLCGPSKLTMQLQNTNGRTLPFICSSKDTIKGRWKDILKTLITQDLPTASFCISIDAKQVPSVKQLAKAHLAIIGDSNPQHFVIIEDSLTPEVVYGLLLSQVSVSTF